MQDMNYFPLLLGLIVLPLVVVLPFLALRRILRGFGGGPLSDVASVFGSGFAGSWRKLAEVYATDRTPPPGLRQRQTVKIGAVMHKNCVSIGADAAGLYLQLTGMGKALGQPALSIPWTELSVAGSERLFWKPATVLSAGRPARGTITLLPELKALVEPWLNA